MTVRYIAINLKDIADVYAIRLCSILSIPSEEQVDSLVLRDIMSLACSYAVFGRSNRILLDIINVKDDRVVHPSLEDTDVFEQHSDEVSERLEDLELDISNMIEKRVFAHLGVDIECTKILKAEIKSDLILVISYSEIDEYDIGKIKHELVNQSLEKELEIHYNETP